MPVSQLLCEGKNNSPDVRVLGKLLAGICEIKPMGGKYGMGTKIISRREVLGKNSVFGILDGDFIREWKEPQNKVSDWKTDDGKIHFGWRWERKEIENYLIDPVVVDKALGEKAPDPGNYKTALESARDTIFIYQAARIALSSSRVRFKDLPSAFGIERGNEKHPFPEAIDEESCCTEINKVIKMHQTTQVIGAADVITYFKSCVPECQNGSRYKNYLHAFAGKDLLWAMNKWCLDNGFIGAWAFREKILTGIQRTTDEIETWLQEWGNLKEIISRI